MNIKIRDELRNGIIEHLRPYLEKCETYHLGGADDLIELNIRENSEDVHGRLVIRIGILDSSTQVQIPNVAFPSSWRGKGDGMRLIETVYRIAKKHRYALFITQCTDGFYNYLLTTCGAARIDYDSVEITEKTLLVNDGRLAVREFGDGYKSSYEAAEELEDMSAFGVSPSNVKIIHGRIKPRAGAAKGIEVDHAWIEMGDFVIETSNERQERYTKNKYYDQLHAIDDRVYSVAEAKAHAEKSGKFGPWN